MNASPASSPPHQPARWCPTKMHICIAGAPGSAFTSASPSTNLSLVSQARRSCTSAWMIPQIAAAPKPSVPTLRNTSSTSQYPRLFSVMAALSTVERNGSGAGEPGGALVDNGGGRDIAERHAAGIEEDPLVLARAAGLAPGDDLAQLGVDLAAGHDPGVRRMGQAADRRALAEAVDHH